MTSLLLYSVLTTQVYRIVVSCPSDEKVGVCDGGNLFPQLYCDNVDEEVRKWTCRPRRKIRCVCSDGLWRRMDGRCVRKEDCENKKLPTVTPKVQKTITTAPRPDDAKFAAAVKVIENLRTIELLRISHHAYDSVNCICIKSTLQAKHLNASDRTIECYKYVPITGAPASTAFMIGRTTMIKVTDEIYFQVSNVGGTKILLKDPEHPHPDYYDDHPPFGLEPEYDVLIAKETCLVVAFGPEIDGKRQCMVWGTFSGTDINQSECYNVPPLCAHMYDVWEGPKSDPCLMFDKEEQWRTNKAQEEELKRIIKEDRN
uniref:Lipocalin n=1 Tax=Rhipicephalus appendiculatus TaxID=34631 RepID=A0A131YS37_RHIAP